MFGHGYKFAVERQKDELIISITEPLLSPDHSELANTTEHEFTRLIEVNKQAHTETNSTPHCYTVRGSSIFIRQLDNELRSVNSQKAPESTGGCNMS
jgi:metal-responsive CopG/Arc/MetJ family transcriptional regulator